MQLMNKLTTLLLIISSVGLGQVKLNQIEKSSGTYSTVTTNTAGVLTFVPEQTLSISGSSLSISRGNTIVIPTSTTSPSLTLQEVVNNDPHLNGTIYSPDNNTSISVGDGNLGLNTDGFLNLTGTNITANGNEIATANDLPYITPEDYGAIGNGTTNDNTAIQNAINAASQVKKAILFSNKTYSVTGLVISDSITMIGMGYKTILATSSNTPIVSITGSYNNIKNIHFKGNSTGSNQNGISAVGNSSLTAYRIFNYVNGCYGENLGGSLIYSQYMVGTNSGNGHEGAFYVSDCEASNCTNGFFFDTRAEYNTLVNCQTYSCTAGFNIVGGNNTITGGKAVQCTYGAYLSSGTNDSHGAFIGTLLNHNTNNVYSTGISNGMLFNDCNIYSGNIQILTSESVIFNNCALGGTFTITTTNSTNTLFNDCRFYQTPTITITGDAPVGKNCDFIGTQPTNIFNDGGKTVDYSATSTITGWSSFTVKQLNYAINGKVATVWFQIEGTSNSSTTSVTLPFTNVLSSKFRYCYGMSNGTALTAGAVAFINTNSNTISWYTNATVTTGLSNTGTKKVIGSIEFQLGN